jgi:hypothetical protein
MRLKKINPSLPLMFRWTRLLLLALGLLVPSRAMALGSWTNVVQAAPNPVQLLLLLPDGTVMAQQAGTSSVWYRLTPDSHGSYINGYWATNTPMAPMTYTRQFYASAVLRDGRVFVAGSEIVAANPGGNTAEIYDPRFNTWTQIPVPPGLICTTCSGPGFSDCGCVILPNGNVMIAPLVPTVANSTVIYDPTLNSFSQGPAYQVNQNEATWVKLPDDSILTIDPNYPGRNPTELNSSERYIPSLNTWTNDAPLPVPMYNSSQEIGAGLLLPDGRAWFIGGNGHTAYYTPSGNLNNGIWTQGPELVSPGVGWDEPAAMMVNGKVLLQTTLGPIVPPGQPQPRGYYEMDPTINYPVGKITQAIDWGDTNGTSHVMLNLPDGKVLVSYGSSTLRIYIPDGVPVPAGKPTISSTTANGNGSYHLTGTKLNGISQGSSFGDDAQMDSNYPLVRATDGSGNVYYLPTFNWSSTSVNTGNKLMSTEFFAFQGLTPGLPYSLVVVANGISSDPVTFYGPVWVDFNTVNPFLFQIGTYDLPYATMAQAIGAVPSGGTINIKTAGHTTETMTITNAMTIAALGGPALIGQ